MGQFVKMKNLGKPAVFVIICITTVVYLFQINFTFLATLNMAAQQVSLRDVYFAQLQGGPVKVDDRIVIVDIGDTALKRKEIAQILFRLRDAKPAGIGIDALFRNPKSDQSEGDSLLTAFARTTPQAVFAASVSSGTSFFMRGGQASKNGLIDFGKETSDSPVRSLLNCSDSMKHVHSFAWETVKVYDPELRSLRQTEDLQEININFLRYKLPVLLNGRSLLAADRSKINENLEGKLILVGSLSKVDMDLHRVPNAGYYGTVEEKKIFTELAGVQIHAISTTMLLNNENLKNPRVFDWVLWIFIYLLSLLYALKWSERFSDYKPLLTGFFYLSVSITLLFLYVNLIERFRVEVGIGYAMILMLMTVEFADIYESVMKLSRNIWSKIYKLVNLFK